MGCLAGPQWRLLMGVKRDLAWPQWRSRGCLWVSNVALPGHGGGLEVAFWCQAWPCRVIVQVWR